MKDWLDRLRRSTMLAAAGLWLAASAGAAPLDFRNAVIVISAHASMPERKAAEMLTQEIEKRTQLRLKVQTEPPSGPAFVLGRAGQAPVAGSALAGKPEKSEGFALRSSGAGAAPLAVVTGHDDRGVVFGTGYLLRQLDMGRQRLELAADLNVTTAPQTAVRGQQLGYRPKTNAYDAWDVRRWEQYIRELAIFGVNTIELIPPRSDDDADSPHFALPQMEMMVEMSRIADEYGLDVSIWYPAMDPDYSNPKTVDFALHEWGEVFRRLPRIDEVFVPGGDPGHTEPKYMMALLEKQTENLHRYHPKAQMWMSPQSFPKAWMDEYFAIMKTEPAWLSGVVFGPQQMYSLPELRERIPRRYPIRFYPDITHSIHSQYPVPDWDAAFALTEGREGINPRPLDETAIFRSGAPYSIGFVTYSEGCNDDVNKFLWSGLGWNPQADPRGILRDFSKFFIGAPVADAFADGLMALEQNWRGPLLSNTAVDTTLVQFQELERRATPQMRANWRFQQVLYRAYYDAFLRDRLISETAQENRALGELMEARRRGALTSVNAAEAVLDQDPLTPRARQLRARVFELAEALFQSIGMQLSVPRYQAIAVGRGANLDSIDSGLNDRVWLKNRFGEVRAAATEPERLQKIDAILNWTNPGPGGFYDDLGDPRQQPHLVRGDAFAKDPEFRHSALIGFGARPPDSGWRLSWFNHAEALFDAPLEMRYTGLDPAARYKIRVVYGGEMPRVPIRLVANGNLEIHGFLQKTSPVAPVEFAIPPEATSSGTLTLAWTRPEGLGGNGRGVQVSEVWLIRVEPSR
jgi:hypothetical protein